jgi:dTDP-4-dehydrorhamnose 3,5-epimerase
MRQLTIRLDGPILLEAAVHGDDRGFFLESYRRNALAELGVQEDFVQDNHSRSARALFAACTISPGRPS